MKEKIMVLLVFIAIVEGFSQQAIEYRNASLFKGKGVIFSDSFEPRFKVPAGAVIYTPKESDIILAESILENSFDQGIAPVREKFDKRRIFRNYNRQYVGFILPSGEPLILINLLNFRCEKKAHQMFDGWEETFIIGHGSYYEQNTIIISVYLKSQILSLGLN
jgi:hypothetical protein